jgi:NAD(P)H-dependent FMN reductase
MQKIQIIYGNIRPGRQGDQVIRWIYEQAAARPEAEAEVLDLRDWQLPFSGEELEKFDPQNPQFSDPLVGRWIQKVREADAYIVVTPEYNHGYTAVLKNALDYGFISWRNKPVGFVGYATSVVGAARAIEQLVPVAVELSMAPIKPSLLFGAPRPKKIAELFDAQGQPHDPGTHTAADYFLDELLWWSKALQNARGAGEVIPLAFRQPRASAQPVAAHD